MQNKTTLLCALALAYTAGTYAHSVALSENFDSDYTTSFPVELELDHLPPFDNFRPLFTDGNGVARPWWPLKDSSSSDDRMLCSHSGYNVPGGGTSNDWIVSRPVEIPTEGYVLTFGAQSFVMRADERRLSDLWVFVTEYQPSEGNLPQTPALHLEQISEGKYPDIIEKDFTEYSLPLDEYAGKTVYISFANLNTDKDILAIDNILVQRMDDLEIKTVSERYVLNGSYYVDVTFGNISDNEISDWKLTFNPGAGAEPVIKEGESLVPGETMTHRFESTVEADATREWSVELAAADRLPVIDKGTVTGLSFIPWHNVLVEEATGMWCGNCPIGIYALENITEHPEMSEYVIPVSVHMTQGSPSSDYMTNDNYSYMLGLNAAPTARIDRGLQVRQFSIADDGSPVDFNNPRQFATLVKNVHEKTALIGMETEGKFNIVGNDTVSIMATVRLRPAITLDGRSYRVGFALTENNVGLDGSRLWRQANYLSGMQLDSDFGGFTSLPEHVENWRWMDVARGVYDFHGTDEIALPEVWKMDEELEYTVEIPIPDTFLETENNGKKVTLSPAVVAANLTLVAFVLDSGNSFAAENSISYPMTEQAAVRTTISELASRASIDNMGTDSTDDEPVYYNLRGQRVQNPAQGIYIVKRGGNVTKVIIR